MTPAGVSSEYELAWNAVNELVRSDYSWSGYERNVLFANNHDGTFSEVAGALGLDFIYHSRSFCAQRFRPRRTIGVCPEEPHRTATENGAQRSPGNWECCCDSADRPHMQ